MKISPTRQFTFLIAATALTVLSSGCDTPSTDATASGKDTGVTYATPGTTTSVVPAENVPLHRDNDIQGVWLAPGFNFTGYSALYVEPTEYAAVIRDNEVHEREQAIQEVQAAMVANLQGTGLFPSVLAGSPTGTGRELRLSNTIIKYEKGGGGARYFAGAFGAGQPHIRVRGQIYDGNKLMAVYEIERSGESAGAHLVGAWMSDQSIQSNDIADLARDLADFVKRSATH